MTDYLLSLQHFADGDAAGAAAEAAGAGAEASGSGAAGQTAEAGAGTAAAQPGENRAGGVPAEGAALDKGKAFQDLIRGEYKQEWEREFQKRFNARHREAKDNADRLERIAPMLETIATRYGVKSDDLEGLAKAVNEDDSWLQKEALRRNMPVSELRRSMELERENRKLHDAMSRSREESAEQERMARFDRESRELKELYPEADIAALGQDEKFVRMVSSGVEMRAAYEALNASAYRRRLMGQAEQVAAANVAAAVASNAKRPAENAGQKRVSGDAKVNISSLTKDQMQDLIRRARAGEKITFK